jgi:TRAP-type C4-dicarboxylate transport system permease small subunit
MRIALDRLYRACAALGACGLIAVFAIMIIETALRKMGSFIPGANDLISWSCAASGFLALPHTFKRGELVRVGLWIERLNPARRRWLELACLSGTAAFAGFAVWATGRYLWKGALSGEMTQGMLEIPLWIPQLSLLVGLAVLLIAILEELHDVARGREPGYEVAAKARMAAGDFSESL